MSYLRALLKISLVLLFLLIGGIAFYTYFYGDEIKAFLVKEINKHLLVKADVKEVDITLWQNFPNFSLILEDVRIHRSEATVISAEEIRAKFSLADLIDRNYSLNSLSISNADLYLYEDEDGKYFPQIWKNSEEVEDQSIDFAIQLQKVGMSDVRLHYKQRDEKVSFKLSIQNAWAKGNFASEQFDLSWNSDISEFTYIKNGSPTFSEKDFNLEAICRIRKDDKILQVDDLNLSWKGLKVNGKGNLDYSDKVIVDLDFSRDMRSLSGLYPLLSDETTLKLDSLDIKADVEIKGKMKGELGPLFRPQLNLNYKINKGEITLQEGKLKLTKIMIEGSFESYNLSKKGAGTIKADTINAIANGMNFHGSSYWSVASTASYYVKGSISGALSELNPFLEDRMKIKGGAFEAELDLDLSKEIIKESFYKAWKKGDNSIYLKLNDGAIQLDDRSELSAIQTEVAIGSNDLYTDLLQLNYNQLKLDYRGKVLNLISHIEKPSETLFLDGEVRSPMLRLEDILALTNTNDESKEKRSIQMYLDCEVDKMSYMDLNMEEVKFYLRSNGSTIDLSDINFNSLGGDVKGELSLDMSEEYTKIQTQAEFNSIDVHGLFLAFKDFGQDVIGADNLYGNASGYMSMRSQINEKGEIDPKSLELNGFIDITEGRLVNYEPLYNLSKYIELEELKEIKFQQLQNQVSIANEEIYIPRFKVRSSAINLEMEGTHTFENIVDYRISLSLDQILGKKAKKPKETEFGYIEDDGLGNTQLFLRMTGNINDPNIAYDRQELGKHLKKEVQEEKQKLKAILKEEFGLFKGDSTLVNPNKEEKKSPVFEIEWEEEPSKTEQKQEQPKKEEGKKSEKKGKFGKFIDKIAKPNEDEYVSPQD